MNRIVWAASLCAFALLTGVAFGQYSGLAVRGVTNQAATISRAEIEDALATAPKTGIKDAALRVVPMGSGYNV